MEESIKYKVSIVTAVYNVEKYLEEMIESIIIQTIGFENVQLILVDDGSQDSSGNICDRYAVQYPENILVIHKENGGVSSARNEGLKYVEGEYINFTDADDKLESNALELMYAYLKENDKEIDFVAIRQMLFERENREQSLNYKFTKTRIIDLIKEYDCVHFAINSTLIKRECFKNRHFDTGLMYAEDAKILLDICLEKMKYGIVCGTSYMYRKRNIKDSALDLGKEKACYYIPYINKFILYSLENSEVNKGYIPQFVQYACMYDLQWRLRNEILIEPNVLNDVAKERYKALIVKALQYIDDEIIYGLKNCKDNIKSNILMLKRQVYLLEKLKEYKVSVVTGVYNVEDYLEEMIESIIAQTIGFQNIQLILVDDGSTDCSGEICDRYELLYPDNIVVIHNKNGGVSSARNEGIKYAEGEYINFTDADDKLSNNALQKMYDYLKKNEKWVDLVAIRTKFFGASGGKHPLDYKFKKTKLVDLRKEYSFIQLFINSTLIKRKCFDTRCFDTSLSYAEDAKLVIDILLDKMCYGIVCGTNYLYRKRATEDSALDLGRMRTCYYIPYIKKFILHSLENAMVKRGYIPQFVQYACMYDLQWRLNKNPLVEPEVLNQDDVEKYKLLIIRALQYIDNKIIQEQKNLDDNYKSAILSLKSENMKIKELVYLPDDLKFCMGDVSLVNAGSYGRSSFEFFDVFTERIIIEGYVKCYPELDDIEIILKNKLQLDMPIEYKAEIFEREEICSFCMDKKIIQVKGFRFTINREEMPDKLELQLCQRYHEHDVICKSITFGKFFPLAKQLKYSYLYERGILLTHSENLLCLSKTIQNKMEKECEKKLQKELRDKKDKKILRACIARKIYHFLKHFKRKELWLISDRLTKADDNGEAFFTYMNEEGKNPEIDTYFVLDKNSKDYKRIKKIGNIVPYHSTKYKILSLLCDKIISAHADEYVINRFFGEAYLYKDILHKRKYVFLQHGVTKDNQSRWLAKQNKNISMFVTVTNREYQSILEYAYYYDEKQVKCTGFPRYDYLYDGEENRRLITFMPTWRNYLANNLNVQTDSRTLKAGFENSTYCQMYQQVFSDNRLSEAAEKYHYSIQLMMHPAMPRECIEYFNLPDSIEILDTNTRYKELFANSKLIITDYSSAVFDFAYLRKPVLYYQQDVNEFFSGKHVYDKGYFDYERDGFGEVEYTAEALVDRIIEYMKNDCQLKDIYRNRIENTFPYNDNNNCKRVYEEIIKL